MTSRRSHHGLLSHKGNLWAVGGSNGTCPICETEFYDVLDNTWTDGPSLPSGRSCAANVVYKDAIWVIGGRNSNNKIVNDVYALEKSQWVKKSVFPVPIMLSSAIVVNDQLFMVGGVTGTQASPRVTSEIYKYNEILRKWDIWADMYHPRMNHTTAVYGSFLIVVGGHTMHNLMPLEVPGAVCFDTTNSSDRKEYTTPMLGSNRIGLSVAMFGDPRILDNGRSQETNSLGSINSSKNGSNYSVLLD